MSLKLEQVRSGREYCDDWCERFRKDNVSLDELSELTYIPTEVLIAHLANTHPHPFYVHPLTKQVCLSSPLMNGVIDRYLNKMCWTFAQCIILIHDVIWLVFEYLTINFVILVWKRRLLRIKFNAGLKNSKNNCLSGVARICLMVGHVTTTS